MRKGKARTRTPGTRLALGVDSVTKAFSGKKALDGASFSVEEGEIFGLLGPNGAGKTTLINILCGLIVPDSGRCLVLGKEISESGQDVFEEMNFVSGTSFFHRKERVKDVLNYYAEIFSHPEPVEKIAREMEITGIMQKEFGELSTGQRTRVLLAKALMNRPKILLLDEPTLGLDPDISAKVRTTIRKLNRENKTTILLTSHYMPEVEALCGRIAFILDGKIVDVGTVRELKGRRLGKGTEFVFTLSGRGRRGALLKAGFRLSKAKASYTGEGILAGKLISEIEKAGYSVLDMETKSPSLEDYFLKMASRGREKEK